MPRGKAPKRKVRRAHLRPARHIYVINLSKGVLRENNFVNRNPHYAGQKRCVYVGLTGLTPEARLAQHKAGIRSCRYVRRFGKGLLRSLGRRTYKSHPRALKIERELASRLRAKGYAVWQA